MKKKVFLIGATGTMGGAAMHYILAHPDRIELTVLIRDGRRHGDARRRVEKFEKSGRLKVIHGDLCDAEAMARGVRDADYVLHVGGMVSPYADHHPEATRRVNLGAMRNIVDAVKARPDGGQGVKVVYIGSVAQLGNRAQPYHWGRAGDPVWPSRYDVYGETKIAAERIMVESGIPWWVSLRQTGILSPEIINGASDPITFHVPVRGVLEWVTAEDSGNLLCNLVLTDLPDTFWKHFYNIGGGRGFRLSNYEFEQLILGAMNCPPARKVFEPNWFATRNFHGMWYEDSDLLDHYLHFRTIPDAETYFTMFKAELPWYFSLARLAPAWIIRKFMKALANRAPLGTLSWVKNDDKGRLDAYFGGKDAWKRIPGWNGMDLSHPSEEAILLDHGYDENKRESEINIDDLRSAAEFRGGRCLAADMIPGDLDTPVEWECHAGHRFMATPRLVLLGGHWCPECFTSEADLDSIAERNPFFAQVYR